jgi:coenzyme F420-0:L-glutamate ligase/coenzyme F420-1:gamma-L-glutamate ligase
VNEKVEIIGIRLPLLEEFSCDLAGIVVEAALREGVGILDGDVIVVTDKLVSKCLGGVVRVDDVKPSRRSLKLAEETGLDPKIVELVIRSCDDVIAVVPFKRLVDKGLVDLASVSGDYEAVRRLLEEYLPEFFITLKEGMLWSNSGVDSSNLPQGRMAVPVRDHDGVAKMIRDRIYELTGKRVAVVIGDTEVFLGGSMDFARGSWGIDPVDRCFGCRDLYGKPKYGGVDLVVHEICSAAALIFKQIAEGVPVAIVRGVRYRECECGMRGSMPRVNLARALREVFKETVRVLGVRKLLKLFFLP